MSHVPVWSAGAVRPRGDPGLDPAERAFRYGDGVFVTLRLRGGLLLDGRAHIERLSTAATAVGLSVPEPVRDVRSVVEILTRLGAGPGTDAVVRIQVSAGAGGRGYSRAVAGDPGSELHRPAWELVELLPPPEDRRLTLTVLPDGASPVPGLPGLKTCSALTHVLCAREATRRGFAEGLRVRDGTVLEASASNVFWSVGRVLHTPDVSLPLYPGVTRARVMAVAEREGWSVRSGAYPPDRLYEADAVFLTNAARGVEPVAQLEHVGLAWPEPLRLLATAVEGARTDAGAALETASGTEST